MNVNIKIKFDDEEKELLKILPKEFLDHTVENAVELGTNKIGEHLQMVVAIAVVCEYLSKKGGDVS